MPLSRFSVEELTSFTDYIKDKRAQELARRIEIHNDFVAGSIVWEKRLGRPEAITMADGFAITRSFRHWVLDRQTGHYEGPRTPPIEVDASWDAPEDGGENYRVNFVASGVVDDSNVISHMRTLHWVRVDNAPGVRWSEGSLDGPWFRDIEPNQSDGFHKDGPPQRLEFHVVAKPFIWVSP